MIRKKTTCTLESFQNRSESSARPNNGTGESHRLWRAHNKPGRTHRHHPSPPSPPSPPSLQPSPGSVQQWWSECPLPLPLVGGGDGHQLREAALLQWTHRQGVVSGSLGGRLAASVGAVWSAGGGEGMGGGHHTLPGTLQDAQPRPTHTQVQSTALALENRLFCGLLN